MPEAKQPPERISRLVVVWSQTGERQSIGWRHRLPVTLTLLGIVATVLVGIFCC